MQGIAWCGENFPVNIWPLFAAGGGTSGFLHSCTGTMALPVALPLTIWRKSIRIEWTWSNSNRAARKLLTRSRIGCDPKGA
jgi:hypothetical protein